jgi:outer membrane protein OmpA-like peptidoglycan-associated protein
MKTIKYLVVLMLFGNYFTNSVNAQSTAELFNNGKYAQAAAGYEKAALDDAEYYLWAAKSYTALKEWDKAIEMYEKYRDGFKSANKAQVNELISILRKPTEDIKVENLGGNVNSRYGESSPRISSDGNKLYFFSSDRPGGRGGEDVWVSNKGSNGEWQRPSLMPSPITTTSNEAPEVISNDGNMMILFGNYEGYFGGGDIFYSYNQGDKWTTPCNMGGGINSSYFEADVTISPDGKTILFTSEENRVGRGSGDHYDIYISHLENGAWTTPKKLPSSINLQKSNQRGAFLSSDGRTLYFSSTGHASFGGYDLFVTRRIGEGWDNWTKPENMGKEVNTVLSDLYISVPASGSYLYFNRNTTGNNNDGYGQSDMFRMEIPREFRPEPVVNITGIISNQDNDPIQATLFWSDLDTGKQLGYITSDSENGEYLVTLPYGKRYLITANQKGYLFQTQVLDLRDGTSSEEGFSEVEKNIQLNEATEGARIVLRNIYFDTGSANLRDESQQELDRLYDIMEKSGLVIEIGGHTDDVGREDSNEQLSQARAEAVRSYVIDRGIAEDRIQAKGYGETEPIATNETEEGRQENRRVEIKVLSNNYQREGTGDVLDEGNIDLSQPEQEEVTQQNLYELYRNAAFRGGLPARSSCYGTIPNNVRVTNGNTLSSSWYIDDEGNDVSAFGGSSINFITHTGQGSHVFSSISGAGVLLQSGKGNKERSIWGYFLGDAIGGGIEWMTFKDLSGKLKLPLSFDYGMSAFLVFNKEETTVDVPGGNFVNQTSYTSALGIPLTARIRYNMQVSDIKISPYASYNYNLMSLVDIEPNTETDSNGDITTAVGDANSWIELGARAKYKFITGGLGLQNSDGGSAIMLRAGLAF